MDELITVSVNGSPVRIHRGMKVRHALIAFDQEIYAAAMEGRIVVEDSRGFRIGLDGALSNGARILTRPRSSP
jgi:sulfur carrier protein ThiS